MWVGAKHKREKGEQEPENDSEKMLKQPGLDEEVPVVEPGEGGLAVAHLLWLQAAWVARRM